MYKSKHVYILNIIALLAKVCNLYSTHICWSETTKTSPANNYSLIFLRPFRTYLVSYYINQQIYYHKSSSAFHFAFKTVEGVKTPTFYKIWSKYKVQDKVQETKVISEIQSKCFCA